MSKGEIILAETNVYVKTKARFHMDHKFVKQGGDLAGRITTIDFFVKIKEDGSWSTTRIPDFFIKAIKNV